MSRYSPSRIRAMRLAVANGERARELANMRERLARLAILSGTLAMGVAIFYGVTN